MKNIEILDRLDSITSDSENWNYSIQSNQWTYNSAEGKYQYTLTHTLNSTNILYNATTITNGSLFFISGRVIDNNNILIKSDTNDAIKLILSAKYVSPVLTGTYDNEIIDARMGKSTLRDKIYEIDNGVGDASLLPTKKVVSEILSGKVVIDHMATQIAQNKHDIEGKQTSINDLRDDLDQLLQTELPSITLDLAEVKNSRTDGEGVAKGSLTERLNADYNYNKAKIGTINTELVGARVDGKGTTHSNINTRINAEVTALTNKIDTNTTSINGAKTEIATARGTYPNLKAKLDAMEMSGGGSGDLGDIPQRLGYLESNLIYAHDKPEDDNRQPIRTNNLLIIMEIENSPDDGSYDTNIYDLVITKADGTYFDAYSQDTDIYSVVPVADGYTWGISSNNEVVSKRGSMHNALGKNGENANVYGGLDAYHGSMFFLKFDQHYDIADISFSMRSYSEGKSTIVKMGLYTLDNYDENIHASDNAEFFNLTQTKEDLEGFDNSSSEYKDIAYMTKFNYSISYTAPETKNIWQEVQEARHGMNSLKEVIEVLGHHYADIEYCKDDYWNGDRHTTLEERLMVDFEYVYDEIYNSTNNLQSVVAQDLTHIHDMLNDITSQLSDITDRLTALENAR